MKGDQAFETPRADPAGAAPSGAGADEVSRKAAETFGTQEKAQRWLHRPTSALAGSSPLAVASAGREGIDKVLDLLRRIDHGLAV